MVSYALMFMETQIVSFSPHKKRWLMEWTLPKTTGRICFSKDFTCKQMNNGTMKLEAWFIG